MEKHHSRSLTKKAQPVNDDSYDISSMKIGRRTTASEKPSREDVSFCINIWARLYRLDGDAVGQGKLHLPPRRWDKRSTNGQKRFD